MKKVTKFSLEVLTGKATVNELKIIIFVLNYLTVLVYTKTIIHLSVGG